MEVAGREVADGAHDADLFAELAELDLEEAVVVVVGASASAVIMRAAGR